MTDLSGTVSGLVSSVSNIQDAITYINQQLLLKPDIETLSNFRSIWNSQLQTNTNYIDTFNQALDSFESTLIGLILDVRYLSGLIASGTGSG